MLRKFRNKTAPAATARWFVVWGLLPLLLPAFPAGAQKALTPEQKEQFGAYIREYLKENPDVIVEALRELERRRDVAKKSRIAKFIDLGRQSIFHAEESPVGGNPNGDVTLVEFFDYNCPYCKSVTPQISGMLKKDGNTRFVYKEFPILGETSVYAAKAALAAARQDPKLYERFHVALLAVRGRLSKSSIIATAKKVGVDVARMKSDMSAPEVQKEIDRNRTLAKHLGINGTPAFVVGNRVLNGLQSGTTLQAAVDAVRKARNASNRKP